MYSFGTLYYSAVRPEYSAKSPQILVHWRLRYHIRLPDSLSSHAKGRFNALNPIPASPTELTRGHPSDLFPFHECRRIGGGQLGCHEASLTAYGEVFEALEWCGSGKPEGTVTDGVNQQWQQDRNLERDLVFTPVGAL